MTTAVERDQDRELKARHRTMWALLGDRVTDVTATTAALAELGRRYGADTGTMQWEYLLVTARRA